MARPVKSSRKPARGVARWTRRALLLTGIALFVAAVGYVVYLDHRLRTQFEGKRWALPARVYARPLELYAGMPLSAAQFMAELESLHYRSVRTADLPGTYQRRGEQFQLVTREFTFWDGPETSHALSVDFQGPQLASLKDAVSGAPQGLVRMDPAQIGGIYTTRNEDRVLVRLKEVPRLLIDTLLAVEDRSFYYHHGISTRAILRAMFSNLRAGGAVQGGSTLTQQLVKNFFLTNERTLSRKVNEALMALLLEWHYQKAEILETYLNEVYLGQDGARAIHGFGLASQFYFQRPLNQLQPQQIALLVALVKGPSFYDPRRNPQRAKLRRDVVLDVMAEQHVLTAAQAQLAKGQALGVVPGAPSGITPYPAYLDLVKRQLRHDYREQDLTSEGLQIFTTLDPQIQASAEQAISTRLRALEKQRGMRAGVLQGAAVVTSIEGGEIVALVGGRDPRFTGFNRALDAQRQIGSLVKPAIYLTALAQPNRYTLASTLDDSPLSIKIPGQGYWTPQDYDRQYHGRVLLVTALAHSYNIPTVRLGLDVGVPQVVDTLHRLGIEGDLPVYPSLLLGAINLTPFAVAQMYQTLAAGGFRTPLRAIRDVLTVDGKPLQRYPLTVLQAAQPAPVYLVTTAMQQVVRRGTAVNLSKYLPTDLGIAGKTGTTDDMRDSWFAGFTGDKVAVVWVGRDDNKPAGFSGATGALTVWGTMMRGVPTRPLQLTRPSGVEDVAIDNFSGQRTDNDCEASVQLPFIAGSAPSAYTSCHQSGGDNNPVGKALDWIKGVFQ
ncbi:MAG: penicillin-binding protein 1B [Gammaproteobacteria bacterium]